MGWFAKAGIKVELVPLPGSTDCVKLVATKRRAVRRCRRSSRSRSSGRRASRRRIFYTAYQGNIYGIAVPADSPIKTLRRPQGQDDRRHLDGVGRRDRRARARRGSTAGTRTRDISIVVAGEAAQTAALLRSEPGRRAVAVRHPVCADRECRRQAAHARRGQQGDRALPLQRLHRARGDAREQAHARRWRWRKAMPRARCSRSPIRRPRSASCGRCIRRPRRPARTRRRRSRDDIKTLEARAKNWRLGGRRRHEMGRELRDELRRLRRLPGEERRAQGEGRRPAISSPTI